MNDTSTLSMEVLKTVDKWSDFTFFSGDGLDFTEIENGLRWIYAMANRGLPELFICDSPLKWNQSLNYLIDKSCLFHNRIEIAISRIIEAELKSVFSTGEALASSAILFQIIKSHRFTYLYDAMITHAPASLSMPHSWFSEESLITEIRKLVLYDVLGLLLPGKNDFLDQHVKFLSAGVFLSSLFNNMAIIIRRPSLVRVNSDGHLHFDGGPAIAWHDGFRQYFLNGVRVPEEVALPHPMEIDPSLVLRVRNVAVRREIVRKIGIERVVQKLGGEVTDRWNGYELIKLNIPGMRQRPTYLKMRNPSIGTFHIEGVSPRIKTCKGALKWRTGGLKWQPEQLT